MKSLSSLLARPKILDRADEIINSFSASGKALFYFLSLLIIGSGVGILFIFNDSLLISTPERGAVLSEGIIGTPRFINPVLAITDADRDMTMLIYSGLLKATPTGDLAPDLAERYEVSPDGRTYTVYLRKNATFHDGKPLTAEDVAFTIHKTVDPIIKSPNRANWQGVNVTVIDPYTITFGLAAPYTPFADNLTMGILPKHLWQNVSAAEWAFSNLNTSPIGSGPFRIAGITRTPAGIATSYELQSFADYSLGEPYIKRFTVRFYDSEDSLVRALGDGSVESGSGISPAALNDLGDATVLSEPLNRVFGVFFNQNQNAALQDNAVRKALSESIDREELVDAALGGYAVPLSNPIPPALERQFASPSKTAEPRTPEARLESAKARLANAGWKPGTGGTLEKTIPSGKDQKTLALAFTVTTSNVPELRAVADGIVRTWRALGADVSVEVFEPGDLAENVIRPRRYDALLFGEIIGRGLDLFAFWDSSQRNDPGLNIAMYANSEVDGILAKLRASGNEEERHRLYTQFEAAIADDAPAVFLYSPNFLYIVPNELKGVELGAIASPADRFDTVQTWYRSTDRIWKIFADTNSTN
jgi:peptide/nickel transport system substrate-binding protein